MKILKPIKTPILTLLLMFFYILNFSQNFNKTGYLEASGVAKINTGDYSTPVFADIDGDGNQDIYIGATDGKIYVFKNDGSGIYTSEGNLKADGSYINFESYSSPEFFDIDGDNDLDLFVGENYGYIYVFENDGNGIFSSYGRLQADGINIDVGSLSSPEFADIDDDNDKDLYIGASDGKVYKYINDGDGNFSANGNLTAGGSVIDVGAHSSLVFADIDGDNDLDLYISEWVENIYVYKNDGNGNFASSVLFMKGEYDSSLEFADIDKDNDLDFYVGERDGYIKVHTNDGSGNFTFSGELLATGSYIDIGYFSVPEFADIDGDGNLDLYVGEYDGFINVFKNDGSGNFATSSYLKANVIDIDVGINSSPEFADIDGDGDLDLYVGEYDGYINVFINEGGGTFISSGYLQVDGTNIDVGVDSTPEFADLDGDGDLDLYVGEYDGYINVFINNGSGNFTFSGNMQANGTDINLWKYSSPKFNDLDSDNDLDLFLGGLSGYINVFNNDGNNIFTNSGYLQADGFNISVEYYSTPEFVNISGNCIHDLYIGFGDGRISVYSGVDNTDPIITSIHNNITEIDEGNCQAILKDYTSGVTATDNCDANLDVTQNPTAGTLISGATNQVTLTITDDMGNTDQVTFNVAVEDNTVPVITSAHNDQFIYADANCETSLPDYTVDVTATDNCDANLDVIQNPTAGTTISGVTNEITITVTDDAGNTEQVIFNVTVEDNTPPIVTSTLNDQVIYADANCEASLPDYTGDVTSTDNCDENLDITQNPIPGSIISGATNNVLLIVTDDSGNYTEAVFNVAVQDNSNPIISSTHNDQTADADANCETSLPDYTGDVTATDNCDTNLDIIQNPTAGTVISGTTNQVTLTVTDDAGNTDQVIFNVTVEDNTTPVITSTHNDQTIYVDANCEASLPDYTGDVSATDNCDTNIDITQNPTAGTVISGTTNQVTLRVTDDAGNIDEVIFNISLEDNTNPVISSTHNDQTVDASANCEGSLPDYTGDVTATDNCDTNLDITQNPTAGTVISGTTNQVTLTVRDDAGNIDEVTFNITVEDNTNPVISSTHNDQTVDANANCEVGLNDYTGDVTATDNCDTNLDITQNPIAGTIISGTTNQVTLTVTDDVGNIALVTFNVMVEDNTNPEITSSHSDQTIDADANCDASLPDYTGDIIATDNCDTNLDITQNPTAGTVISGTTNQVTLTVTDDTGNTDEVTFKITVEDNTNPVIICVIDQTVTANETHHYIVQGIEFDPTETNDNCGDASLENNFNYTSTLANAQLPEGTTTIIWTITDNTGNENSCSFDVIVNTYVGIESLNQHGISIYPNPTNGKINFEFGNNYIQKITISDITGKHIIEKTDLHQIEKIDLSSFNSGIFIISIQTSKEIFTTKIIKR